MLTLTRRAHRLLLAGAGAVALTAAPLVGALGPAGTMPATANLANCPPGQILDPASGNACIPAPLDTNPDPSGIASPAASPINPEQVQLQTDGVTSRAEGDVGSIPEVNGIPCNSSHSGGGSTGACIGLATDDAAFQFQQPHSTLSSSP
jgi:hypothetical protein